MLRLFVALTLPADVRDRLRRLTGGIPGARWTPPENLHLTLRFVGDVDEGAAADLDAELSRIAFPAFTLTLDGVGTFGASRRPRTLWVGVAPSPDLGVLQGRVEAAAQRAGQPAESRKFHPHVTLARLTGGGERLGRYIEANGMFGAGPFSVSGFSLMRSRLGSGDPVYDALRRYGAQFAAADEVVVGEEAAGEDWTNGDENG